MDTADRNREEARKKEEALTARMAELKKAHEAMQRHTSKDK